MRRDKRKIAYESAPFNLTALTLAPRDLRFFWSRGHLFVTIRPNGSGDKNEVLREFNDVKTHKFKFQKEPFGRNFKAIGVTRCPTTSKLWVTGSGDHLI